MSPLTSQRSLPVAISFNNGSLQQAYSAAKLSLSQLHSHLGLPSYSTVSQIVSNNKLAITRESSSLSVCDACQQGKSHQLPYPNSSSVSKNPLKLIFSDVQGPESESIGRKKYYVS
jgi:hypothetical protein